MPYVSGTLSRIVSKRIASAVRGGRDHRHHRCRTPGVSTTEPAAAAARGRGLRSQSQRRRTGCSLVSFGESLLLCRVISPRRGITAEIPQYLRLQGPV